MIVTVNHKGEEYKIDLSKPLDISIPVGNVKCFYAPDAQMVPFKSGEFVGAVKAGGPVNFFNVTFNPHGNGTHTESIGHITVDQESINDCLKEYHFLAKMVSVELKKTAKGDYLVTDDELRSKCQDELLEALVIRTMPNFIEKQTLDYSGTNPPYLSLAAMQYIVDNGVKHLLIDLPSVDREEDDGEIANHKLFWNLESNKTNKSSRVNNTITELIYVPDEIEDGLYLINIQAASLDLDAAPSRPVLYRLIRK